MRIVLIHGEREPDKGVGLLLNVQALPPCIQLVLVYAEEGGGRISLFIYGRSGRSRRLFRRVPFSLGSYQMEKLRTCAADAPEGVTAAQEKTSHPKLVKYLVEEVVALRNAANFRDRHDGYGILECVKRGEDADFYCIEGLRIDLFRVQG